MFRSDSRMEQEHEITRLVQNLADLVPVAACSGNHDNAGRIVSRDRASVYEWFVDLGTYRNVITDGSTRKLENLIVTMVPCHCSRQEKSIWLDARFNNSGINADAVDRSSSRSGPRIVRGSAAKNRNPENFSRLIGPITSSRAIIIRFPRRPGRAGTKNWAKVTLLVPGQLLGGPYPNRIAPTSQRRAIITASGHGSYRAESESPKYSTRTILALHWGTLYRTIGTKDTAIAGFWAKHRLAASAFVEELAGISWHHFEFGEAANRTYQDRFQKKVAHARISMA
jgi:hypothetical protein